MSRLNDTTKNNSKTTTTTTTTTTTLTSSQEATEKQIQQLVQNVQKIKKANELKQQQQHEAKRITLEYIGLENISIAELKQMFGKTRLILLCGPQNRAHELACELQKLLRLKTFNEIGKSDFYSMYQVGNHILSCSHGMGSTSIGIFLNELIRIFKIIDIIKQIQIIRIGSSGGIGVEAGSLVVTSQIVNSTSMKSEWIYYSCSNPVYQPCQFDPTMSEQLFCIAKSKQIPVYQGKTMSTETYYEGQGRMDGALCTYDQDKKMEWLNQLYKQGVRNFEMEGEVLSGMCTYNGIPCAMICVAYLDRLEMDTTPSKYSKKELESWMERCIDVVLTYIKKHLLSKRKPKQET